MLGNRIGRVGVALIALVALLASGAPLAAAQGPSTAELLAALGVSADEIARVEKGEFVTRSMEASTERELVAAFLFFVPVAPGELVRQARQGLVDRVDPNTLAYGLTSAAPSAADFAKLVLKPDAAKQAQAWVTAKPGGSVNLSSQEIASFAALGRDAAVPAVEAALRSSLLARLEAYRQQGLAGIAPYALGDGKQRSPADELRSATRATKNLQKYVPAAYQALLDYPNAKPPGLEETFRWTQLMAHGEPTIVLTHSVAIPDGEAWVVAQRQFYVSTGYNCEQAIAAFLPAKGGTLVVYSNRTSTDQVSGFGGSAKRSLGGKILASQLEDLFQRVSAAAKKGES
jgi:hypothetical protein